LVKTDRVVSSRSLSRADDTHARIADTHAGVNALTWRHLCTKTGIYSVFIKYNAYRASILIFFGVPPIFNQWRGEAQSREKAKFVMSLALRRVRRSRSKRRSSDEPESLANRNLRPLTEYPEAENEKGDIKKAHTHYFNQRSIRGI
jgi:hypothetical protein